jgi:ribonuclease PH
MGIRNDGREPEDLRPLRFTRDYTQFAAGSVLVEMGNTRVLCTASVEARVPPWLRGKGRGWVTAEYSMLPGSTSERTDREAAKGKQSGRTQEIQRLIGRSLRAVTDGGTRTASICGGYIALHDACSRLVAKGAMKAHPLDDFCAAISVGVVDALPYLDLEYTEDVRAEVDMNVVMAGSGRFIEVQGTAEGQAFSRGELDSLLDLAQAGIATIVDAQREMVSVPPPPRP